MILVLAHYLGEINNGDVQCYSNKHPRDIGDCLKHLVDNGWLEKFGRGRGTHYSLPTSNRKSQMSLFSMLPDREFSQPSSDHLATSSDHLATSSDHFSDNSDHFSDNSDHLTDSSDHFSDNSDQFESLKALAAPVRYKKKVQPQLMQEIILKVCQGRFLTQQQLAEILNRSPDRLRTSYLSKMVKENLLELRYPDQPTHPDQAYRTFIN
ncbi:hypothetical protein [Gloeothece verrucosa]|uniref:hypothetical protein n=1 Tax=Gloeothece verrucosa TaxID=2546359 RepID=UPI00017E268C|nr:hypothetical protein [Gloeothece verrucosa]